jgi:hypothetical protein
MIKRILYSDPSRRPASCRTKLTIQGHAASSSASKSMKDDCRRQHGGDTGPHSHFTIRYCECKQESAHAHDTCHAYPQGSRIIPCMIVRDYGVHDPQMTVLPCKNYERLLQSYHETHRKNWTTWRPHLVCWKDPRHVCGETVSCICRYVALA